MAADEQSIRRALADRRDELAALSGLSAESRKPVALDQQSVGRLSRMDAMQMQAMAEATERQRAIELTRVEAALARLEAGDFGCCARCDEPIGEKRLQLDPATPFCIDCAGKDD